MTDLSTLVWKSPVTVARTVDFTISASGSTTVFTPDAGKRFCVHYLVIEALGDTSDNSDWSVQFRSGASTALSGSFAMNFATPLAATRASERFDRYREFNAGGFPIFIGRANGDAFTITVVETPTMAGGNLVGFCVITQIDGVDA